jgi:quinol monooxygenase YgiN
MSKGIVVMVRYKAQPGMEVITRQELMEMLNINRKAKGCNDIALHRDLKKASHFMTVSHWDGMDDFMALLNEPHIKDYAKKSKQILEEPFEVTIWQKIDG